MPRIVLAGSVFSSRITLERLIKHQLDVVGVLGFEPDDIRSVSGYVNMRDICSDARIPYKSFVKLNDEAEQLRAWTPDVIFVVGLSQLVDEVILRIPRLGCIGFHPTALPEGRGRAPLAWLILEQKRGSATFFHIGAGVDDGPIFVQKQFDVSDDDDAASVCNKLSAAICTALDIWLPELKSGQWCPIPQDETQATYYGKRTPEDGWINWEKPAQELDRLIKATTRPHPGAYTFFGDHLVNVWKSKVEEDIRIRGVPGRILLTDPVNGYLVQCGCGLLWICEFEIHGMQPAQTARTLRVGHRLGYYSEYEIFNLRQRLSNLEQKLR